MKKASVSEERSFPSKKHMPDATGKSLVMSLAKGFKVLEIFSGQSPELNLSEIANRADLDVGTAYRLVRTLVLLGYLQEAEDAKRYRLGLKVIDLGFTALSRMDLHSLARPILRSLVGPAIEAASLGILSGSEVVYIERVQAGLAPLGISRGIGSRVPAYCSGVGHAIMAFLPAGQRLQVLESRERIKLTPYTLVTIPEIEDRLAKVREQGYALSDQELVPGVRAIAAPILDRDGYPLASLSAGAPSFACSIDEFIAYTAPRVIEGARSLARALSVSGSSAISPSP